MNPDKAVLPETSTKLYMEKEMMLMSKLELSDKQLVEKLAYTVTRLAIRGYNSNAVISCIKKIIDEGFQENGILQKLVRKRMEEDKITIFCIVGETIPRDYVALKICEVFDKNFGVDRVFVDLTEFIKSYEKFEENSFIYFPPESTLINPLFVKKAFNMILQTLRPRKLNVIFSVKEIIQLDISLRESVNVFIKALSPEMFIPYKLVVTPEEHPYLKDMNTIITQLPPPKAETLVGYRNKVKSTISKEIEKIKGVGENAKKG